MTDVVARERSCDIKENPAFICLRTTSGYRSKRVDYLGLEIILPPDVSNQDLGNAALECASKSRFVLPEMTDDTTVLPGLEFDLDPYDWRKLEEHYKAWVARMQSRFHYKTKRQMFKSMKNVSLDISAERTLLMPWTHDGLESWSRDGLTEADDLILPPSANTEELGAAIRLALSRCK